MVDIDSVLIEEQILCFTVDLSIKDNLKFAIILTLIFLFFGGWPSLICSIGAIYIAVNVSIICLNYNFFDIIRFFGIIMYKFVGYQYFSTR